MGLLFLKTYWKHLAILAVAIVVFIVVFATGYYNGYQNQKQKFNAYVTEQIKVAAVADAQNKAKVKAAELITKTLTKEYEDATKDLTTYYKRHPTIKWVQNRCSSITRLPEVSVTASTIDDRAESDTVSTEGISPLDCALDVLQLLTLQKWVRDQESNE